MPLTYIEIQICGMVVRRFLDKHEATSRNALLRYFKTSLSESLQRLTNCNVLTNLNQIADDETYLPRAIAFNYCGDAAAYSLARESTEIVLQAARKLYDDRGSDEYNLALGESRANAFKSELVKLGVGADRIKTTSLGKEQPFCTDSNEQCWQQNRRDHLAKD